MAKKPSEMTPAQYRAAMIARRKKKKDARTNASEFANLGSAKGMQKETNKARNEGRSARLGTGNPMKSRGADPANLAGKGGRGTGLNLAKKTKQVDIKSAAAKRRASDIMSAAEKKAKQSSADKIAAKDANMNIKKTTAPKAKKYNVGVSKGGVSFKEAFNYYKGQGNKTFTWNGKKYTTDVKKAAPKAKVSTPTPADFSTSAKKAAPKKTASKDPRKGFASKATPGKAKSALPAGAKPFKGSYNSKTHKLQNIKGKTYTVPKGK